ncbi:hypothetical protein PHJA_002199500 [Phtheirospermum japonicum]|uniref:Protein TILLER ANGLE CONTROL 1 n=1 Tax=Phtheirospermum japonicum TaxID=374723 RepID=A0A830CZX9_9LAMI|nr:hypothetical protein PHJA_002199500 [Phtheirospermum japonicum]
MKRKVRDTCMGASSSYLAPSSAIPLPTSEISKFIKSKNFWKKMKIFNWVQRKFSNNKENAENNKNNGGTISVIGDDDHQLWSGGILTIGTFGYDPFKDIIIHEENDHFHHEEGMEYDQMNITSDIDDDSEDEDEDEEKPFGFEAYEHELEEGINYNYNNNNYCYKREFEYVMMEKKERITLADLFNVDHEENKLIVEEARPIHKLNQMVRRMMRRKIHPDLSPLNSKVSVETCEAATDNASLLPTQGVAVATWVSTIMLKLPFVVVNVAFSTVDNNRRLN